MLLRLCTPRGKDYGGCRTKIVRIVTDFPPLKPTFSRYKVLVREWLLQEVT